MWLSRMWNINVVSQGFFEWISVRLEHVLAPRNSSQEARVFAFLSFVSQSCFGSGNMNDVFARNTSLGQHRGQVAPERSLLVICSLASRDCPSDKAPLHVCSLGARSLNGCEGKAFDTTPIIY